MLYVQLDTNWAENRKMVRAGFAGRGLHALVLCLAKREERDGWVSREVLESLYQAPADLIDRLIELRALEAVNEDVRPWDWRKANLSAEAIRRKKSDNARAANHARWHHGPISECEKCRSSDADPVGLPADPDLSLEVEVSVEPEGKQQQEPDPAWSAEERTERIHAATLLVAEARAEGRTDIGPRWIPAAAAGIAKDHHDTLHAHLVAIPRATPEELVALIEDQPRKPEPINTSAHLRPVSEIFEDQPAANWSLGRDELAKMRLNRTTVDARMEGLQHD